MARDPDRAGSDRDANAPRRGTLTPRAARAAPLEARIEARLAALLPAHPRVPLCVAFSGGLDSTVLLAALALRARPSLRAVHVDHGLHAESGAWAARCRATARRLGVPLTVLRIDVLRPRGASLEAAAREARYAALGGQLARGEALLSAQHLDDQLETVLLQLLRGAGLRGLAAMPAIAPFAGGWLARPLLDCERAEIEAWARARALEWIEDPMNTDERLDRNYVRRRIVPLLRARWPAAGRAVSRSARHIAEAQRLLDLLARADAERAAAGAALSVKRLRALPPDRRRNALRYWIAQLGGPLPDARRLEQLCGPVIDARADAHPEVEWGGRLARREGDRLTLADGRMARPGGGTAGSDRSTAQPGRGTAQQGTSAALSLEWAPRMRARSARPAVLDLPSGLGRLELAPDPHGPIDLDALPRRLSVRLRSGGERLRPRRGGPSRALKSLLQEARIPHAERACLPLVWSGEQLLAAGDLWVDAAIRVGAGAGRRGRLVWHRGPRFC